MESFAHQPPVASTTRTLNNYHPATNLNRMYADPAASADVYFVFSDEHERIPAHRCLLAVASPVFQSMFFGPLRESTDVRIVDASADAFREFLQFFYCDKIELSQENIHEVLTLADKYDVAGLMNMAGIYLEFLLNNQTVCWVYELAIMFGLGHLVGLCEQRLSAETGAVLSTAAFRTCSRLVLQRILESDRLSCDEFVVFTGAMEWAAEACKRSGDEVTPANCKAELGACFQLIRFPTMSSEEFTRCLAEPGLFEASEFLSILSYLTLKRETGFRIGYSKEPRRGNPTWTTKDADAIMVCDRRSQPSLHRLVPFQMDATVFTVNERILLGQLSFSSFKTSGTEQKVVEGRLEVRRKENPADTVHPDEEPGGVEVGDVYTSVLQQSVSISSTGYTKQQLVRPLVLEPFVEYQIHSDWDLEEGDQLVFRTHCRAEVMVDGGVRFQFQNYAPVQTHDCVVEGLLARLYFKKW